MNLESFAAKNRLRKPKVDECGDFNIIGKRGHIYEHGAGRMVATILNAPNAQHWNKIRDEAKASGCQITQSGDTEGSFLFDASNKVQAAMAIKAIQVTRKRKSSNNQRKNWFKLTAAGQSFNRETTPVVVTE